MPLDDLDLFAQPPREGPATDVAVHLEDPDDDGAWRERLRDELRKLYYERAASWSIAQGPAFVCADDARRLMERDPSLRPPPHRSMNALGGLFRKGWKKIGRHISTQSNAHGNEIFAWAPVEARESDAR